MKAINGACDRSWFFGIFALIEFANTGGISRVSAVAIEKRFNSNNFVQFCEQSKALKIGLSIDKIY
jgi:hypothetical protein